MEKLKSFLNKTEFLTNKLIVPVLSAGIVITIFNITTKGI